MNYSITENSRQTTYSGVDLIKFICSFLVVAIHIHPLSSFSPTLDYGIINYVARLAVPFFLTSSGYFVFRKTELNDFSFEPSLHFVKKILRLYGTWILILFVGEIWHLWYMEAAVVAVLLVSVLRSKKISVKYIVLISAILYIIGLLGDSYYGLIEPLNRIHPVHLLFSAYRTLFGSTKNGVFMGMIFVSIGMLFAYVPIKMKEKYAVGGFIISMILLLGEVWMLKYFDMPKESNMYVFLVPAVFFLFYIATHIKLKNEEFCSALRVLSILMFYSHMFVYCFIDHTIGFALNTGMPSAIDNSLVRYCSTVLLTLALSYAIYKLSQTKRFNWLKWIYS